MTRDTVLAATMHVGLMQRYDADEYSAVMASSGRGSDKVHPRVKVRVKATFQGKCCFCGTRQGLSVAHIINKPGSYRKGFHRPVDINSPQNYLYLCGHLGKRGTCHDAFDSGTLCLVPGVLNQPWRLLNFDKEWRRRCNEQSHVSSPSFNFEGSELYRRGLATRLRWTLIKNSNKIPKEQVQIWMDTADAIACLSRSASEIGDVSSLKTSPEKPERPNRAANRAAKWARNQQPCQERINAAAPAHAFGNTAAPRNAAKTALLVWLWLSAMLQLARSLAYRV